MVSGASPVPRRLSDLLAYTQRFRLAMCGVAVAWYVAVVALNIDIESGPVGKSLLGVLVSTYAVTVILIPRLSRLLAARGYSTEAVYAVFLALDALVVAVAVTATGGRISIVFVVYYVMAIGNCYMFNERGTFIANSMVALSYTGTLVGMELAGHPYAPTPMDWIDILLVRVPFIYLVSGYARWLAERGDRLLLDDQEKYLQTLRGFLNALEARDGYTMRHAHNVAAWAAHFARHLGASEQEATVLAHGGELHDIGKIGVPDSVLKKPGKLLPDEYQCMQEHPTIGLRIAKPLKWFSADHLAVIRHHHERWDGTGYPSRLKGSQIPYVARLTALCDVYDALTHNRPYRLAMPVSRALAIIAEGRGTQFDPRLTDAFLAFLGDMMHVLRQKLEVTECGSGSWLENGLYMRVDTPQGPVLACLGCGPQGWEWRGAEPLARSEDEDQAVGQ